jgi:trimethylamine--corrinoid protein Co-methyltransferase
MARRSRADRAELRARRSRASAFRCPPPVNALGPVELLEPEQVEAIHDASLRLLEEVGIEFMGRGARAVLADAGAPVDDETGIVRVPREVVEEALSTAPSRFTVTPRNPERLLDVGGGRTAFGLVAGPPTVHDRVGGRRTGNLDDYVTLVKLAQCFEVIHFVGNQPTAPQELPPGTRHLDTYLANLTFTDRVFHCLAIGRHRTLDAIEMTAISRGLTLEEVVDDPCVLTIISVNSPRRFDEAMSDGLMTMAAHGQPVVVTPFS